MKTYQPEAIRNVGLFGHQGTGKTSLAEALVFLSGATTRVGRIEDGNTVCDFEPEEIKKGLSVSLALTPVEWHGHKINLIDVPGYADFIGEAQAALRVVDLAIFVLSAVEGVQVQHQIVWSMAGRLNVPRVVFINKLDRERASFSRTLAELSEKLGSGFAPVDLPIGEEHDFSGVVDVLSRKAYRYDGSGSPGVGVEMELSGPLAEEAERLHTQIEESVAESDDVLLERYLDGGEITMEEVVHGLAKGLLAGSVTPVLVGSATKLIGIDRLADSIVEEGPSPLARGPAEGTRPGTQQTLQQPPSLDAPTSAFVFKTVSDPYVGRISIFRVFSPTPPSTTPRRAPTSGSISSSPSAARPRCPSWRWLPATSPRWPSCPTPTAATPSPTRQLPLSTRHSMPRTGRSPRPSLPRPRATRTSS
jgi:elongation factor G